MIIHKEIELWHITLQDGCLEISIRQNQHDQHLEQNSYYTKSF